MLQAGCAPHGHLRLPATTLEGKLMGDFPGGPVVKNPPSNAGDMGSIPGWGAKIPQAVGQLSPWDSTREKPLCCNKRYRMLKLRPSTAKKIIIIII